MSFHKILAFLLIFCLGGTWVPGLFVPAPAYAINEKLTTAIVSVDCPPENNLMVRINESLTAAMVKSHRFDVTDAAQVTSTLKDMGLEGVALNMNQACNVGRALGVQTVTMAQGYGIESDNEKCYITIACQVIDVESGIIIQSAFAQGEGYKGEKFELTDDAVNNAILSVVNQMNDNFSKTGLIALYKEDEIRINIGGDIGIKDNSEFVVYRENKVIGKLKTKELDSYDTLVEKELTVPGYTVQEGDIIVLASNQGEEITSHNSPQTVQTSSSKAGLILFAILAGVALAVILSNESSQIQSAPATFILQNTQMQSNGYTILVTIAVRDSNGAPVADGTTIDPVAGNNCGGFSNYSANDTPLQYKTVNGMVQFYVYGTITPTTDPSEAPVYKDLTFQVKDTFGHKSDLFSVNYRSNPVQ